jgi:hypothetical protein
MFSEVEKDDSKREAVMGTGALRVWKSGAVEQ